LETSKLKTVHEIKKIYPKKIFYDKKIFEKLKPFKNISKIIFHKQKNILSFTKISQHF